MKKKTVISVILVAVSAVLIAGFGIVCWNKWNNAIGSSVATAKDAYDKARDKKAVEIEKQYYDTFYKKAEAKYHVKNRATIMVKEVQAISRLEVLKVADVEYIVENEAENEDGITAWLEVPGYATYTVDLEQAEYIIDEERNHLTIRMNRPELTSVEIDYDHIEKLHFSKKKGWIFNGNYKQGEDLFDKQMVKARQKMQIELNEPEYHDNAEDSAVEMLESLVRSFNPDDPEIEVDVFFVD